MRTFDPGAMPQLHKMKARIEIIADFEGLKKLTDILRTLSNSKEA